MARLDFGQLGHKAASIELGECKTHSKYAAYLINKRYAIAG
jgi:hypothetical protein